MAGLLSLPENLMVQHLLPLLNHNDVLRLRRVSKQTKDLADTYLWMPTRGHLGKWELEIDPNKEGRSLQAFLGSGQPPPPSRMQITHKIKTGGHEHICPSCSYRSFFEDDHLEEFMGRYSEYVTRLSVDVLRLPLTSDKEIRFYESLKNLEKLCVLTIKTVGGSTQFEEKTRNAEGGFLIKPSFQKLRNLKVISTDCMDSMWNFVNGVSNNLDVLSHPFKPEKEDAGSNSDDDSDDNDNNNDDKITANFALVRALIERRRLSNHRTLWYNWSGMSDLILKAPQLLPLLAVCRDNGVMLKNFPVDFLDFLLHDENGRRMDENYRGNMFVGNIIHSLTDLQENVFLMELPALVKLDINGTAWSRFRIWEDRAYPEWPNLRKLYVRVNSPAADLLHFLCGCPHFRRSNLEDLYLNYFTGNRRMRASQLPLPCPKSLGISCGNIKKLTITHCHGDNKFFAGLWTALQLLEEVNLSNCPKLSNKGFIGSGGRGSVPVFLGLKNLKRFGFHELKARAGITDGTFKKVFRHLKLSSFHLCSDEPLKLVTLAGINELLSGQFAETIEKLDLNRLALKDVPEEELMQVVSLFRSSKML